MFKICFQLCVCARTLSDGHRIEAYSFLLCTQLPPGGRLLRPKRFNKASKVQGVSENYKINDPYPNIMQIVRIPGEETPKGAAFRQGAPEMYLP